MKPLRIRYKFHDQQSLIKEDELEQPEINVQECEKEKYRRYCYLKRRSEEEKQNKDSL